MGQPKKRQVVGHSYGPTRRRQLAYYGVFLAFVVVAYLGLKVAVSQLDKAPPKPDKPAAPWAQGKDNHDQSGRGLFAPEEGNGVTNFQ